MLFGSLFDSKWEYVCYADSLNMYWVVCTRDELFSTDNNRMQFQLWNEIEQSGATRYGFEYKKIIDGQEQKHFFAMQNSSSTSEVETIVFYNRFDQMNTMNKEMCGNVILVELCVHVIDRLFVSHALLHLIYDAWIDRHFFRDKDRKKMYKYRKRRGERYMDWM